MCLGAGLEVDAPMVTEVVTERNKEAGKLAGLRKTIRAALQRKIDDDVATIFNAIRDGDADEVKLLLSKGFKPNAVDYGEEAWGL